MEGGNNIWNGLWTRGSACDCTSVEMCSECASGSEMEEFDDTPMFVRTDAEAYLSDESSSSYFPSDDDERYTHDPKP